MRRERRLAEAARQPSFIYHGGGRRVIDYTVDELHADAPRASVLGIIIDTLKFWANNASDGNDDEDDDDSALNSDAYTSYYGDEHVLPEDQHLFMPRAADPESDAEYRTEVERHDRRDRIKQVRPVSSNISRFVVTNHQDFHHIIANCRLRYIRPVLDDWRYHIYEDRRLGVWQCNLLL